MKKNTILFVLLIFFINCFGQVAPSFNPVKYSIDTQITQQIKKIPFNDSGILTNSMTIKVFWDDKPFFNQDLDCYTRSTLKNDSIYITGYMIGELGWGFQLALFGDSCILTSFALSDEKIYKYKTSDNTLLSFIPVPNSTQKIKLSKKPSFKKGERVSGFVELESKEFYYSLKNSYKKATIKLKAYFKTSLLSTSE